MSVQNNLNNNPNNHRWDNRLDGGLSNQKQSLMNGSDQQLGLGLNNNGRGSVGNNNNGSEKNGKRKKQQETGCLRCDNIVVCIGFGFFIYELLTTTKLTKKIYY